MKIKICGITHPADAVLAEELGADYIGLVFAKHSHRRVSVEQAREIVSHLTRAQAIGVFVEHSAEEIKTIAEQVGINMVQVYHRLLTPISGLTTIYAMRLNAMPTVNDLMEIRSDYLLLDGAFDLNDYQDKNINFSESVFSLPVVEKNKHKLFLAGGIKIENVSALKKFDPYAIDICSYLEIEPGIKDENKMRKFFKVVDETQSC